MGFINLLLSRVTNPDDWHVEDSEVEVLGMRQVDGHYVDFGGQIQVTIREPDLSLIAGQDYGWDVSFEQESYVEVYNDGRRRPIIRYTAIYERDMMTVYEGTGGTMLDAAADLVEQLLTDGIS